MRLSIEIRSVGLVSEDPFYLFWGCIQNISLDVMDYEPFHSCSFGSFSTLVPWFGQNYFLFPLFVSHATRSGAPG